MNTAGDNWSEAVPAIFAALAVVLAGWLVLCAVKKFKKWRRAAAGSAELKLLRYAAEAVKNGELREKLAGTPRSVASMDRIYLPQIQRDFPEFNWNEFRTLIEGSVAAFLRALDERNPALVRIPGLENEQLSELVKSRVRQELVFHYQKIRIHRTAIKKYERKSGTCSILAETSLEYMTDEPDDLERLSSDKRRKTSGSGSSSLHKKQAVYETELLYVQDSGRFGEAAAAGFRCPNCGAPVKSLGMKRCEYCQSALEPFNVRVWKINFVKEA